MKLRANISAIALAILTSATAAAELPAQQDDGVLAARASGAVNAYLALWGAYPAADAMQAFEEHAVLEYAHSLPELHAQVSGRQSMITQVQAVAQLGEDWKFTQPKLFPTLYPNIYYAGYVASGSLKSTGQRFERNVIIRIEMGAERVSRLIEFSNPAIAESTEARDKAARSATPDSRAVDVGPFHVRPDDPS